MVRPVWGIGFESDPPMPSIRRGLRKLSVSSLYWHIPRGHLLMTIWGLLQGEIPVLIAWDATAWLCSEGRLPPYRMGTRFALLGCGPLVVKLLPLDSPFALLPSGPGPALHPSPASRLDIYRCTGRPLPEDSGFIETTE